jgi:hypothetical protein
LFHLAVTWKLYFSLSMVSKIRLVQKNIYFFIQGLIKGFIAVIQMSLGRDIRLLRVKHSRQQYEWIMTEVKKMNKCTECKVCNLLNWDIRRRERNRERWKTEEKNVKCSSTLYEKLIVKKKENHPLITAMRVSKTLCEYHKSIYCFSSFYKTI